MYRVCFQFCAFRMIADKEPVSTGATSSKVPRQDAVTRESHSFLPTPNYGPSVAKISALSMSLVLNNRTLTRRRQYNGWHSYGQQDGSILGWHSIIYDTLLR